MLKLLILYCTCLIFSGATLSNRRFPADFKFGAGSSSYQIEGAWNEDGKGLNVFDFITHRVPSGIKGNATGDVACDSYHKYKEDVILLKQLGVDYYRFSLSWSRIFPTGFINQVNEAGVQYYKNLIAALKQANIEPVVTIFHWDLPLSIQKLGGFTNPAIIDLFLDYATFAYENFGDDVKVWTTFNEPHEVCTTLGHSVSNADFIGINEYLCAHNILKAHARAYHIYDKQFRPKQGGKIAITLNLNWYEPSNTSNPKDVVAAETQKLFVFGWFANPIVFGDYPQIMIDRIRERSLEEGFNTSRLPEFTSEEKNELLGTYDFIGLNHYTSYYAREQDVLNGSRYDNDIGVEVYQNSSWKTAASTWLKQVPWGFRKILKWIKDTYNNPEIIVTENGFSDEGELNNERAINYYEEYLSAILDAIYEDKVRVVSYSIWSLLDSFEWGDGYTVKFGLYQVDFNDPERKRTPKTSVKFYKNLINTKCLVDVCTD